MVPIREEWGRDTERLIEDAARGEITHAVMCYRTKDGDLKYRVFNEEHGTYLIGLMARCMMTMHDSRAGEEL
jgi:hypothetical protein